MAHACSTALPATQLQLKRTVHSRVQTAGRLRRKWPSSLELNKHIGIGLPVVHTTDVRGGRTSVFRGGAPAEIQFCAF